MIDSLRPTVRAMAFGLGLILLGTVGYRLIGGAEHGWIDALYMAVITITTVGYGEVIDLSQRPLGRLFTIAFLLGGVGTLGYLFSTLTAFFVEGTLEDIFWRRRMKRTIDSLTDHYIVCGAGHTGEHVIRELLETKRSVVVIEGREDAVPALFGHLKVEVPTIVDDATSDAVLLAAGVERAQGLVSCVSNDKDNLIITFSARNLNPDLRIVTRCVSDFDEKKLRRAGANAVVSPNRIGGLRLVSEMVRPTVVSFLDSMLRDREQTMRVEEVTIEEGSALEDTSAGDLRKRKVGTFLLVAVGSAGKEWTYGPDDEMRLGAGARLVFMGEPAARTAVEKLASAS